MPRPAEPTGNRGIAALVAAFEGALESVPFIVVAGLIAFAPLGEAMPGAGIAAAFLGALLVSLLAGVGADRRGLVAGPSLGLALMVAGALEASINHGALTEHDARAALSLSMGLTIGCGVLMAAISALGIGRLAPLVPYPVLAGLRNGIAVLLVLEQFHAAAGMPEHGHGFGGMHPGALIVTAVTVLAMFPRIPGLRQMPPVVLSLVAGTLVHHALGLLPAREWLLGPVTASMPPDFRHLPWFGGGLTVPHELPANLLVQVLLPTMLSMTVLALLETIACAAALQNETGERGGGRRDLLAIALANIGGGMLGALPMAGSLEETIHATGKPGGQSRAIELLRCGFLLLIAWLAMPLLTRVPNAVLAGVIIAVALKVADVPSLRSLLTTARAGRRQRIEGIGNLLVALGVAAVAATLGLVTAVIAGAMLSLVVFVADMARGPVRRRYVNPIGRSRARRGDRETEMLLREGAAIEVIELQGALFFGSTDQVASEIEASMSGGGTYAVLDLHRVHRMDLSGARGLLGACERLWKAGRWLVLAGMRPGLPAWDYLNDRGLLDRLPADRVFSTLEDAIESAEARLLSDRLGSVTDSVLTGAQALMSLGIPEADVAALLRRMTETAFPAETAIVSAGDTSRDMFILLAGRVDVMLRVRHVGDGATPAANRLTRVATLAPGTLFGEMSLLSNAPRSANLVAHGAVRCLRLDLEDLTALRAESPDSAWHLLRAIALQIELNLRLANAAIASYEE